MADQKSYDSHFVPKVYLNRFTNSRGKLFKLRQDINKLLKPSETHPSKICYKRDFYKFSTEHIIKGYRISEVNILEERGFIYENRLDKLISKVIDKASQMSIEDAMELSIALFDIKFRNEYTRTHAFSAQNINASINNIIGDEEEYWLKFQKQPGMEGVTIDQLRSVTESIKKAWTVDDTVAKELHNRSLLENIDDPSPARRLVYNKLARGNWMVFKTTLNYQFITSDNPGFCQDDRNKIFNIRFAGRCTFFFPLTPYYVLAIFCEGDYIDTLPEAKEILLVDATPNMVLGVNQATWRMANREVYSSNEMPLLKTRASINTSLIL